jgi:hypothetical protein
MKKSRRHAAAAERINRVIMDIRTFLPDKTHAYGAAHEVQPRLWALLLEPYRCGSAYQIPAHIVREIPRLTRCLDRVLRIVNAPDEGDLHGEHPWMDLAGDAIAGEATRRLYLEASERLRVGSPPEAGACGAVRSTSPASVCHLPEGHASWHEGLAGGEAVAWPRDDDAA